MMRFLTLSALVVAGAALPAMPAAAQTTIIYGNDKCPSNTVCVRRSENERYRIPQALRGGDLPPSEQTWASRAASTSRAGASTGIGSCSNVGPGGSLGCTQRMLKDARDERRQAKSRAEASAIPDYTAESQVTSENPR